jgi:hypothetical protein
MKKQALILIIIFLMILTGLACFGIGVVNQASANLGNPASAATATSAAQEFHIQLTLTAGEAALGISQQRP